MMTQSRSTTTTLFQPSLRDWRATWKAQHGDSTTVQPTRVKKFVAYKRRKQKLAEAAGQA